MGQIKVYRGIRLERMGRTKWGVHTNYGIIPKDNLRLARYFVDTHIKRVWASFAIADDAHAFAEKLKRQNPRWDVSVKRISPKRR